MADVVFFTVGVKCDRCRCGQCPAPFGSGWSETAQVWVSQNKVRHVGTALDMSEQREASKNGVGQVKTG